MSNRDIELIEMRSSAGLLRVKQYHNIVMLSTVVQCTVMGNGNHTLHQFYVFINQGLINNCMVNVNNLPKKKTSRF